MEAIKIDEMPVTLQVCNEIVDGGNKIDVITAAWIPERVNPCTRSAGLHWHDGWMATEDDHSVGQEKK